MMTLSEDVKVETTKKSSVKNEVSFECFKMSPTDFVISSKEKTLELTITQLIDRKQDLQIKCNSYFFEIKQPQSADGLETKGWMNEMEKDKSFTVEIGLRDFKDSKLKIEYEKETYNYQPKPPVKPEGTITITSVEYIPDTEYRYPERPEIIEKDLKLGFNSEEFDTGRKKYKEMFNVWDQARLKKIEEEKKYWKMRNEAEKKKNKKCCSIL